MTLCAIERLLLPAECLLCQRSIREPDDPAVCAVCRSRWRRVMPPYCRTCGQPTIGRLSCQLCADWPPGLVTVRSAVWLDDGARAAVHALKYDRFPRLARELVIPMARVELPGLTPASAAVAPVPLGSRRRVLRGYNQSEALARALAARWGAAVAPALVTRPRETATQTNLTPAQRRRNVQGAFRAPPTRWRGVVVLVDDVFTTGATLAAAAAALLAGPATRVYGLTFARAPLRDFGRGSARGRQPA